ncbi:hypothetical protein AVEN_49424-1 [Araneus ventricosus]|uniref:Uncharacterized protein n=1 Tax=Araneus ventricosus TaxID=182803 RepID=A0A4Y2CNP7_ARAVE|nr:hypothetical protein AVEN_49424-1 [Araneus ventricosus]
MKAPKGYRDEITVHHSSRPLSMSPPFSLTSHCILYATFSTAKSNMSPGMLSTARNLLSFKVVNLEPHEDRPWTSNNSTGKNSVRLEPGRMDMENVVYRMQCVVHEKVTLKDHHMVSPRN